MEKLSGLAEALINKVEGYGKTTLELTKLKAVKKIIPAATIISSQLIILLTLSLFMILFNIGIAMWVGELLGKDWYGFLAVAGFYLLLSLILHFSLAKWMRKPVSRFILKQVLN